jgi:hypothetical protein
MDFKELSNFVRKKLGIPVSEEPLPDVLYDQFEKPEGKENFLWALKNPEVIGQYATLSPGWVSYRFNYVFSPPPGVINWGNSPEPSEDSTPFETDLTVALVGWRIWKVNAEEKALQSQNFFQTVDTLWRPDMPFTASCGLGHNHAVPAEFCQCGIYAKDDLETLEGMEYAGVYGQVYGWGRYVRGDKGWRAQYAYPKRFYLTRNYAREISPETMDILKAFHVPIYVEQPMMFYNPEEDGYISNHEEYESWNFSQPKEEIDSEEE